MNRLEIPTQLGHLTPEWLTAALRQTGTLDRAVVRTVGRELLGEGRGFTGQVVRLRLDYDLPEPSAPRSIIAKLPSADATVREALHAIDLYAREVRFYQDFGADSNAPIPSVYYTAVDSDGPGIVLLLEDLTAGRVGDNLNGCTKDEAILAVEQLARFHASSWDDPRLTIPWLAPIDGDRFQQVYQQQWEPFRAKLKDELPARLETLGVMLLEHVGDFHRWLNMPPHCIVHGDFRLDNLFFANNGAMRPLTIFDWQLAACGRGVADVAYFAAFCLPIELRQRIERDLVRHYHDTLVAGGVRGYDEYQCWHDYQFATLGAFVRLVIAGGLLVHSSERGALLAETLLARTDAILVDHDVEVSLVSRNPFQLATVMRQGESL